MAGSHIILERARELHPEARTRCNLANLFDPLNRLSEVTVARCTIGRGERGSSAKATLRAAGMATAHVHSLVSTNSRVGRAFRLNHGASGSWPGKPRRSYSNFAGAKGKQLGRGPGPGINEFADWNDVTQKDKDLPI
jgi:hypothetical protein